MPLNQHSTALQLAPLAILLSTTAVGAPQGTPATEGRGDAAVWSSAMIFSGYNFGSAPNALNPSEMYLRQRGVAQNPPELWSSQPNEPAGFPDYTLDGFRTWIRGQPGFPTVDFPPLIIDAHSSGNAVMPRLAWEAPLNPNGAWMSVAITVTNQSEGRVNSIFSELTEDLTRLPGADIVSRMLDGSVSTSPWLEGLTVLESRKEEIGLLTLPQEDLTALDYGIGVLTMADLDNPGGLFPNLDEYYFSVSKDWTDSLSSGAQFTKIDSFDPFGAPITTWYPPHPANIYRLTWDSSNDVWSPPELYLSYVDLDLDGALADIDALEVDPGNKTVMFSLTSKVDFNQNIAENRRSELMVYQMAKPGADHPQRNASSPAKTTGGRLSKKLGVRDPHSTLDLDGVDGICVLDPEPNGAVDNLVGHGRLNFPINSHGLPMGLSVVSSNYRPNGIVEYGYDVLVSGWGGHKPFAGKVELFVVDAQNDLPSYIVANDLFSYATPPMYEVIPLADAVRSSRSDVIKFRIQSPIMNLDDNPYFIARAQTPRGVWVYSLLNQIDY